LPRDASRLLVLSRETEQIRHHRFTDLPDLLAPGDLVVVNRSRVFPARLLGRRAGGTAEILLLRMLGPDSWEGLVRPSRRLRIGDKVDVSGRLEVTIASGPQGADNRRRLRLMAPREDLERALEAVGRTPLPPYIRRTDRLEDKERYQTVYARESGSVAAPTAGLHFTKGTLDSLSARGIERAEVVLHIGPGTFQPVRATLVEDHRVEAEAFRLPEETALAIARARGRGGRVVAVGTTTVRVLESAARPDRGVTAQEGETKLVIVPPFRFQVVDILLTNFHLPRSSLLLLVSALAGRERVLAAYAEALREGYRFYSYGDAMLIL